MIGWGAALRGHAELETIEAHDAASDDGEDDADEKARSE
jgi:hypothetical protein